MITMKKPLKFFDIACFCISLLCGAYLLTIQENPQGQPISANGESYSSYTNQIR